MGNLYKGVCYPELLNAKLEACSAQSLVWGVNQTFYSSQCEASQSSGNFMMIVLKKDGKTFNTLKQDYPTFSQCDHTGTSGLAYEWFLMAMGLLVIVWGGKQLLRLFENHSDKD